MVTLEQKAIIPQAHAQISSVDAVLDPVIVPRTGKRDLFEGRPLLLIQCKDDGQDIQFYALYLTGRRNCLRCRAFSWLRGRISPNER
jgi:hypothetical protein